MLSSACLSDDSLFAHTFDKQSLPQAVVDLVRSGMQQIFALEINFGSA